jgi:hypothetical protein
MNPSKITLSHPTYVGPSGATGAATYSFMTKDYKPPSSERHLEYDVVHNQNGKFKYVYDNGPGFKSWAPFTIRCDDNFLGVLGGNAQVQYGHLSEMWDYPGILGMKTPEGTYFVHWSGENLERGFIAFPYQVGDTIEWDILVQFEEAQ